MSSSAEQPRSQVNARQGGGHKRASCASGVHTHSISILAHVQCYYFLLSLSLSLSKLAFCFFFYTFQLWCFSKSHSCKENKANLPKSLLGGRRLSESLLQTRELRSHMVQSNGVEFIYRRCY